MNNLFYYWIGATISFAFIWALIGWRRNKRKGKIIKYPSAGKPGDATVRAANTGSQGRPFNHGVIPPTHHVEPPKESGYPPELYGIYRKGTRTHKQTNRKK